MTRFDTVLSRGNTSDVYAIGVDAVVKVPRPGVPDHWIEIEATHAAAAHEAGLPTPMVLDVLDVDGRPAIVFERVDGPSMLERLATRPQLAADLAEDMAAIQRAFHACVAPPELPDTRDRVRGKIDTAQRIGEGERAAAHALLDTLDTGTSVCHGDVHPGNILMGEQGPMVIDWFDATSGPPVADAVRSSLLVRPIPAIDAGRDHLPGVPVDVLDCFHRAYVTAIFGGLEVSSDAALSWEAVIAVSRLAEPVDSEIGELLSVWSAHGGRSTTPTPLGEVLLETPATSEQ